VPLVKEKLETKCLRNDGRKTVQYSDWNIGQNEFRLENNMLRKVCFVKEIEESNRIGCWPGLINNEFTRLRRVNGSRG
jgi:hypothetical protein